MSLRNAVVCNAVVRNAVVRNAVVRNVAARNVAVIVAAVLSAAGAEANAADLPSRAVPVFVAAPVFTWSGAHVGVFLGGGSGLAGFSDPRGASLYGDKARTPFVEGGGQVGYDVQLPTSRFVLGVEADGGALGLSGSTTCLASSGFLVADNCRATGTALATGTGRIGYAFGTEGRTLAYARGGVAALFGARDVAANNSTRFGGPYATVDDRPQIGFTVGAGLEQALTNAWSLKIEYDYADFGTTSQRTPLSQAQVAFNTYAPVATGPTSIHASVHELKLGLNYHFGAAPGGSSDLLSSALAPVAATARLPALASDTYAVQLGGRYWYSFGRYQKNLAGATGPNNVLQSRLTYSDRSSSGELFGRVDTPLRVFVKGFVGAGGAMGGHHNDEDFASTAIGYAYSNTLSGQTGTLDYATVDVGYTFLEAGATKVGAFVGYNYDKDNKDGLGCRQTTGIPAECAGANARAPVAIGITQDDRYDSLRVGANGRMAIGRVQLEADAAYLPVVGYSGVDDHLNNTANGLRLQSGRGQGVQLELLATYDLTPNLNVGIGGRYWAMWVPDGTTFYTVPRTTFQQPVATERYGLLAQAAYRFGETAPAPLVAKY